MKEKIYEILDWNLSGSYETKQKCTEEILSLLSIAKSCTTCRFADGRYMARKCCYCSKEFSMWKQGQYL